MNFITRKSILKEIIILKNRIKTLEKDYENIIITSNEKLFDVLMFFFKDIFVYENYANIYYHGRQIKIILTDDQDLKNITDNKNYIL